MAQNAPSRTEARISAPVQPVLVSVAGTTLNANVSRLGDFVLANVPEGPLELRFTGEGIAAILPLGTLAGGGAVRIAVEDGEIRLQT